MVGSWRTFSEKLTDWQCWLHKDSASPNNRVVSCILLLEEQKFFTKLTSMVKNKRLLTCGKSAFGCFIKTHYSTHYPITVSSLVKKLASFDNVVNWGPLPEATPTKSDQIRPLWPNPTKSDRSDQIRSNSTALTKSDQIQQNPVESDGQIRSE